MHWDKSFKSLGGTSAGVEVPHHQKRPPDLRNMNAQVTLYEDDPGPEAIARAPLTQMTTIANVPLIMNIEHDPGPNGLNRSLTQPTNIDHDLRSNDNKNEFLFATNVHDLHCIHRFGKIIMDQLYAVRDAKDSKNSCVELSEASLAMPIEGIG